MLSRLSLVITLQLTLSAIAPFTLVAGTPTKTEQRSTAVEPAVKTNNHRTEHLSSLMNRNERPDLRENAALELGDLGDSTPVLDEFLNIIQDHTESQKIRAAAVDGIGRYANHHATEAIRGKIAIKLLDLLRDKAEPLDVRRAALYGLAWCGDRHAVKTIKEIAIDCSQQAALRSGEGP